MATLTNFKVRFHSMRATDVAGKNAGGRYSDPFLKVNFDQFKTFETKPVKRTLAPVWDEDIEFIYETRYAQRLNAKYVEIECWDKEKWMSNNFIGRVRISLHSIATGPARQVLSLCDGTKVTGKLDLCIEMQELAPTKVHVRKVQLEGADTFAPIDNNTYLMCEYSGPGLKSTPKKNKLSGHELFWEFLHLVVLEVTLHEALQHSITLSLFRKKWGKDEFLGKAVLPFKDYYSFKDGDAKDFRLELQGAPAQAHISGVIFFTEFPQFAQMIGGYHDETGIHDAHFLVSSIPNRPTVRLTGVQADVYGSPNDSIRRESMTGHIHGSSSSGGGGGGDDRRGSMSESQRTVIAPAYKAGSQRGWYNSGSTTLSGSTGVIEGALEVEVDSAMVSGGARRVAAAAMPPVEPSPVTVPGVQPPGFRAAPAAKPVGLGYPAGDDDYKPDMTDGPYGRPVGLAQMGALAASLASGMRRVRVDPDASASARGGKEGKEEERKPTAWVRGKEVSLPWWWQRSEDGSGKFFFQNHFLRKTEWNLPTVFSLSIHYDDTMGQLDLKDEDFEGGTYTFIKEFPLAVTTRYPAIRPGLVLAAIDGVSLQHRGVSDAMYLLQSPGTKTLHLQNLFAVPEEVAEAAKDKSFVTVTREKGENMPPPATPRTPSAQVEPPVHTRAFGDVRPDPKPTMGPSAPSAPPASARAVPEASGPAGYPGFGVGAGPGIMPPATPTGPAAPLGPSVHTGFGSRRTIHTPGPATGGSGALAAALSGQGPPAPTPYQPPQPMYQPPAPARPDYSSWRSATDQFGRLYYFDTVTGRTSWAWPPA